MNKAFEMAHRGMRERAKDLGLELSDLGCTALALLFNRETGDGVVGQVGDGAILGLTKFGQLKELSRADDGGDAQSTYTLNRPDFQKYLDVQMLDKRDRYVAFFVMTDGVSGDLLYSSDDDKLHQWGKQVDENLRGAASSSQAAVAMLNWLATYQVKGSWDDRTLVVVTQQDRS